MIGPASFARIVIEDTLAYLYQEAARAVDSDMTEPRVIHVDGLPDGVEEQDDPRGFITDDIHG